MTEKLRQWFTVQTYSGYENKVKANLEQRIASMGMEEKIFNVLVPTEEKVVVKDGKTRHVSRKLFPSYVLVEMVMDDQSWYVVRHTPGVTGFVGAGNHPLPVTQEEIEEILRQIGYADEKVQEKTPEKKPAVECCVGDFVRLNAGPFTGSVGPVQEVYPEKGKLIFVTNAFGRETQVEVDSSDIEIICRVGDSVCVMTGELKGARGLVTAIFPEKGIVRISDISPVRMGEIEVDYTELVKL